MKTKYLALTITPFLLFGCKNDSDTTPVVNETLNTQVIADFSNNIAVAEYADLKTKASLLYTQVQTLSTTRTDENLSACRQTWRDAREIWEQSEAQLFGPVETDNIDPHIDTWPVNFTDLNAQLASGNDFTTDYIDNLDDALKGFHPIEYLIFGKDGDKKASDLTDREMDYLTALTLNLKVLVSNLQEQWNPASTAGFYTIFITAGDGSTVYATKQAALEQLVSAMADICGEVANSKMKEPYDQQDPSLEESPFAQSSITDFTNNIIGIRNVYLGVYQADGKGIEDIVKSYNLSLDNTIKTKLSAAITSLGNISQPFGSAIINQKVQVTAAMAAIDDLKTTLEEDLLPFVKQHSK